jgi:hypothetical protein
MSRVGEVIFIEEYINGWGTRHLFGMVWGMDIIEQVFGLGNMLGSLDWYLGS